MEIIARREGFGDILAEGLIRAARSIGRGSEKYTILPYAGEGEEVTRKSAQFYGHFAEVIAGIQLAFPMEDAGKAKMIAEAEDAIGRAEIIGSCKWHTEFNGLPLTSDVHAEVLSAGLGKGITANELSVYQQRVRQLERSFNCREGLRREHDTLPARYFTDLAPGGYFGGITMDRSNLEVMKDHYYELRGWDLTTGVPTRATLKSLNLKDVADDLEKRNVN